MACCVARFDTEEERKALVNGPAIRTWRMLEGLASRPSKMEDFFHAHNVCSWCFGRGTVWTSSTWTSGERENCPRCSGDGFYRSES